MSDLRLETDEELRQSVLAPTETEERDDNIRAQFLPPAPAPAPPSALPAALEQADPDLLPEPPPPGPKNAEFKKAIEAGFDWPIPQDFRDGVIRFQALGMHFDPRDYSISEQLGSYADILTLNYFEKAGLRAAGNVRSPDLTPDLFRDLRGAFLGVLMSEYRTPTNTERVEIQKTYAGNLLQTVQNTALRQMQENPDNPDVIRNMQEAFSLAKGYQSRLDEPQILENILRWSKHKAEVTAMDRSGLGRQAGTELSLSEEILRFADFTDDPRRPGGMSRGGEVGAIPTTRQDRWRFDQVVKVLDSTLVNLGDPLAASRHIAGAGVAAVQQTRALQDYGLPLADAAQLGPAELIAIRYPELTARLLAATARNRIRQDIGAQPGVVPPEGLEAEIEERIQAAPSSLVEKMLTSAQIGSPVMAHLNSVSFDPIREWQGIESAPPAVIDAIKTGAFNLWNLGFGLAYRAAKTVVQGAFDIRRGNSAIFHDPDGTLRRYADLTVPELRTLSPEGIGLHHGQDTRPFVTGAGKGIVPSAAGLPDIEAIADSPTGPATFALRRDIASGRMTYGTLMAVMNPKDDNKVAIGFLEAPRFFPIAADLITKWGAAGFTLETMQEEWAAQYRALKGEMGAEEFGSDEDVKEKLAEYSTALRKANPLSPVAEGGVVESVLSLMNPLKVTTTGRLALRWAAAQVKNLHHKVTTYAAENPKEFAATVVTDMLLGDVALPALLSPAGRVVRAGADSLQASKQAARVADLTSRLATHSAPAVRKIREALHKIKQTVDPASYGATLQRAEDALDTFEVVHGQERLSLLDALQTRPETHTVNKAQGDLRRAVRNFNDSTMKEFMDELGILESHLHEPHLINKIPLIPEAGRLLADMMQLRGTPAAPRILQHAEDAWRLIKRATEDGTLNKLKLEDAVNLLSLRASSQIRGAGKEFVQSLKESIFNRFGDKAVLSDDGFVHDLLEFFDGAQTRLHQFRQLAGERRAAAGEFLDHVHRSRSRQQARGHDFSDAITQIAHAQDQSANIHFTQSVQFHTHPVLDHLGIDDVLSWTATHDGPGNNLFRRMAHVGETEGEFYDRLAALRGTAEEKEFLRDFAKEYLNAPSINRRFAVDPYSGEPISGRQAGKLGRERQIYFGLDTRIARTRDLLAKLPPDKVTRGFELEAQLKRLENQKAILEKAQDRGTRQFLRALREDPEFEFRRGQWEKADLDWDLVEGYAAAADTVDMTDILIRYQDVTNHDPLAHLGAVRAIHMENAMRLGSLERRNQLLNAALEAEGPEVRKAFDAALTIQEQTGDFTPLIRLREQHPDVFRDLPKSLDENVQYMLDTSKELRHALIDELEEIGWFRNAEEAERWRRPWTSHQWKELIDDEYLDVSVKKAPGERRGAKGLTNNEFATRREKFDWKLVVTRRNAATEELSFPTQAKARRFIERTYGTQARTRFKKGQDTEGKTATGDTFSLLAPLGKNFLNFTTEVPASAGTLRAINSLVKQVAVARTAKALDLPGLRLTKSDVARLQGTPAGDALLRQYVKIGEDNRKFGALRGKWVHHRALTSIEDSELAIALMDEFGEALRESAQFHERFFDTALGTTLKEAFAIPVRAIGANAIFRRYRTWQKNFLNNFGVFGPLAVGGHHKYLFGVGAREGHRLGQVIVFGSPQEINALLKTDPIAREIFDMNVLDDTLGHGLIKTPHHRVMRRILFEDDPSDIANSPHALKENLMKLAGRRGGLKGAEKGFKALLDKINPAAQSRAVRKLEDELIEIDRRMITGDFDALPQHIRDRLVDRKAAIQKKLNQTTGALGAAIRFSDYAGLAIQSRNFRKAGLGRFSDNGSVSAELYGGMDNYAKIRAYVVNRLTNGYTPEQALARGNRYMQRYGYGYLKGLTAFSRTALGSPAISFPLENARIMKNMIMDHPGFFLGMYNALPLMNAISLASAGDDPAYIAQMFRDRSGGFGSAGVFGAGLVIATGYGNYSFHNMEVADPINSIRHPFGDKSEPVGAVDALSRATGNFVQRIAGGNPVAKSIIFGLQGRDSRTGLRAEGKSVLKQVWDNLKTDAAAYMVPPYTPFIGKFSVETAKPATENELKRIRSVGERILEEASGIASFGIPDTVEAGLEPFVRLTQLVTGDVKGLGRKYVASGAYDEDDYLRAMILMSKDFDTEVRGVWEYSTTEDYRELEALQGAGDKAGAQRVVERIAAKTTLQRLGGENVTRQMTEEEFVTTHKKAFDTATLDNVLMALPIARKMAIMIAAVGDGAPDSTLIRIRNLSIMRDERRKFEGTSPTQYRRVEQMVNAWLDAAPDTPRTRHVSGLWTDLQKGRRDAERQYERGIAEEASRTAARNAFYEAIKTLESRE